MKDERLLEMRVFKSVVEAGGFTAAAHALGVSQPFVSQTVSALEHRLGVKLMHRSTRIQRLTVEGEQYLQSCHALIEAINDAEAQIRSSEPIGDLRISVPQAFGIDQIVPTLPGFMRRYPKLSVHFSMSDTPVSLIADHVDVAIRMGTLPDSSLRSRTLCNLQRIVVASPAYLAANEVPMTPSDLAGHNGLLWAAPREHLNHWPFMVDDQLDTISMQGNFRSADGTTLFELCKAGLGLMRLAEHLAVPAIKAGQLVPLLQHYQVKDETAIHAVFLPERQLVPRIRAFVDYMVAQFNSPPWQR